MALGGRWGRLEDDEADATVNAASETDATSADGSETQVIEPSQVRTESDPWSD